MTNTPVSPKVTAGINWGIIATLAIGVLTSITPDMLAGLGAYQSMVFVLIGSGVTALRAYLKSDPLRDAGASAVNVVNVAPAAETPEVVAPEVIAPEVTPAA
jgi:hypothetical protein